MKPKKTITVIDYYQGLTTAKKPQDMELSRTEFSALLAEREHNTSKTGELVLKMLLLSSLRQPVV